MSETAELFKSILPRYPELAGKVAIITGAGKGIGKGIAIRLGREGMKIIANARTAEIVREFSAELKELDVDALAVPADISKRLKSNLPSGTVTFVFIGFRGSTKLAYKIRNGCSYVRKPEKSLPTGNSIHTQ